MRKHVQGDDSMAYPQKPDDQIVPHAAEDCSHKAILSDDDLEHVSAAGDATVPTMNPEVLLGRHARPDNTEENKP